MRELATQSANDTNTTTDREELQKEVDQLSQELTRISKNTEFNTQSLLDGSFDGTFHIGANKGQNISLSMNDMSADALKVNGIKYDPVDLDGNTDIKVSSVDGKEYTIKFTPEGDKDAVAVNETTASLDKDTNTITITLKQEAGDTADAGAITATNKDIVDALNKTGVVNATVDSSKEDEKAKVGSDTTTLDTFTKDDTKGINISSQSTASNAIETIQSAIDNVSAERSKLGAYQNRLEHTINNLSTSSENLTAAESRIRDVDYALAA